MPDLSDLRIARPCPADWASMDGGARVRHCSLCALNVYNLTALTEAEALRLIRAAEGRVCVRLYRRADGTVLTRDCPGAPASVGRRAAMAAALAGAFVASDVAVDRAGAFVADHVETVESAVPVDDGEWLMGEPMPPPAIMGMVELPPPPPDWTGS